MAQMLAFKLVMEILLEPGWICGPDIPSFIPHPKEGSNPDNALIVPQLINPSHKGWDCYKLKNLFDEQTIKTIQRIPISFHS